MNTFFAVEYVLPGPRNQVLHHFTNEVAAKNYVSLFPVGIGVRIAPVVAFDDMFECLMSNPPTCKECGAEGHVVETITNQLVWHHTDPEVEDLHDFDPADGRPQIIFDPTEET